jgi:HEPN domain-containing protein
MAVDSGNFLDWFAKAENDLRAGLGILRYYEEPPTDTICYHAHQAAEKSLKGLLICKGGEMPRTHDLVELLNLCIGREVRLEQFKDDIEVLNKYYIEAKYPPDMPIVYSKDEAAKALDIAQLIFKTLSGMIGKAR